MKPGNKENAIMFDRPGEFGITMAAVESYASEEESKLIERQLRPVKKLPYELEAPYSEVALDCLCKLAASRVDGPLNRAAVDMIRDFDSASEAN